MSTVAASFIWLPLVAMATAIMRSLIQLELADFLGYGYFQQFLQLLECLRGLGACELFEVSEFKFHELFIIHRSAGPIASCGA